MKKISLSIDSLRQIFRAGTHTYPARDWYILVAITVVLIGASAAWQTWTYVQVTAVGGSETSATSKPAFDAEAVGAVEQTFMKRKEEADRYRTVYHFVDPSR
jgi:hypothetical protein